MMLTHILALLGKAHVRISVRGGSRLLRGCSFWAFEPGQCTTERLIYIGLVPSDVVVLKVRRLPDDSQSCTLELRTMEPEGSYDFTQVMVTVLLSQEDGTIDDFIQEVSQ